MSIVVPVYNAEAHLVESFNCLAEQSYGNFEVIMVDDGSKDGSPEICKDFACHDSRFVYVRQGNAGAGFARNHGMDLAHGEFLMFLDADDLFDPAMVETLHARLERDGADVAVCCANGFSGCYDARNAWPVNEGARMPAGVYSPSEFADSFYQSVTSCPWDKMFRASFVRDYGLRYQTLRYSNDSFFVLMALLLARRVVWTDEVLVHYRVGQGGSLRDKMYLNPLCDLDMFDMLRKAVSESSLAVRSRLMQSLDDWTIDILLAGYATLASQSVEACGRFWEHLKNHCLPAWEEVAGRPLSTNSLKRKLKLWALTKSSPKGMAWAVEPFGKNGLRAASPAQWRRLYLRLVVAPLVGDGAIHGQ